MFLAANLALSVPSALLATGQDWLVLGDWFRQLNFEDERTVGNLYSVVLWAAIAALAVAQLSRPAAPARGPRWLWVLGWLSVALVAALVAIEEVADLKDALGGSKALDAVLPVSLADLPRHFRWLVVIAPLAALLAVVPGWAVYTSLRHRPALALLTALAIALGVGTAIRDGFHDHYGTTIGWALVIEDGIEIMAGAILVVVLVERLAGESRSAGADRPRRRGLWAALVVLAAALGAGAFALLAEYATEDDSWVHERPWSYTGPVSLVEQPFLANQDNLTRIRVWAFVDGEPGAEAEIFARLDPPGWSLGPVRESRATVRGVRNSDSVVDFVFEPIPDSGGKRYTVAIGLLSDPQAYVFLGLTGSDLNPAGEVVISGKATAHSDDLAMRTYWEGQGAELIGGLLPQDPRHWFLIADAALTVLLGLFAIVATWSGLSVGKSRFWRGYVWRTSRQTAVVVAGFAAVALALVPVLAAAPHA